MDLTPFPAGLLPGSPLCDMVVEGAEAIGVDEAFVAVPVLAAGHGSRETPAGAIDSRGFSGSDIKKCAYPGPGQGGGRAARRFRLTCSFVPGGDNTPDLDSASGGFVTTIL